MQARVIRVGTPVKIINPSSPHFGKFGVVTESSMRVGRDRLYTILTEYGATALNAAYPRDFTLARFASR